MVQETIPLLGQDAEPGVDADVEQNILLTGVDTSSRLGALAPWIHIAVLERAKIVPTIPDAIALFGVERSALFVTGPSKTADVEGILIKGVHGPGVQVCCLV